MAAYDERAGGVVLFGGVAGPPPESFDDVWTWDGVRWTGQPASTPAPAPSSDGTLVYDAASRRLLLVGGIASDDTMFREMWTLAGARWRRIH